MSFFEFPHTRTYDNDLGWLIWRIIKMDEELKNFINFNTIKYADPIEWDITSQYQANTVVIDPQTGDAYISTNPVPSGVLLTDTNYWCIIYNYADRIKTLEAQIAPNNNGNNDNAEAAYLEGTLIWWHDGLYRATTNIAPGTTLIEGVNVEKIDIEEVINRLNIDLGDRITQLDTDLRLEITNTANALQANINAVLHLDVAEMIADIALKLGDETITMYHTTEFDGGGAKYVIVDNVTPDGYSAILLDNGLVAQLVMPDKLDIAMFGAISGNAVDAIMAAAIDYAWANQIPIYIKARDYVVNDTIVIDKTGIVLEGEVTSPISDTRRIFHFVSYVDGTKCVFRITEDGDNASFINIAMKAGNGSDLSPLSDAIRTESFRGLFTNMNINRYSGGIVILDRGAWAGENAIEKSIFNYTAYGIVCRRGVSTSPTDNIVRDNIFIHGEFMLTAQHLDGWMISGNHDYTAQGIYAAEVRNNTITGNYFDYAKDGCHLHLVADAQCDTAITGNVFLGKGGSGSPQFMIWLEGNPGRFTVCGNGMMSYTADMTNLYLINSPATPVTVSGNTVMAEHLFAPTTDKTKVIGYMGASVYVYRFTIENALTQTYTFPHSFDGPPVFVGALLNSRPITMLGPITDIELTATDIKITKSSAGAYSGQTCILVMLSPSVTDIF